MDFKKLIENRKAKLTPEEREREEKYERLTEENILYKTETFAEDRYMNVHYGKEIKQVKLSVKVYRSVYYDEEQNIQLGDRILLSFTAPMEYSLDQRFIENWEAKGKPGLYIDAGGELFVTQDEMRRIMSEIKGLNLSLAKDYWGCKKYCEHCGSKLLSTGKCSSPTCNANDNTIQ